MGFYSSSPKWKPDLKRQLGMGENVCLFSQRPRLQLQLQPHPRFPYVRGPESQFPPLLGWMCLLASLIWAKNYIIWSSS